MSKPVTVIEGGVVATMDGVRAEHAPGHLVLRDGLIEAVGPGPAPPVEADVLGRAASTRPAAWSLPDWSTPTTTSTSG